MKSERLQRVQRSLELALNQEWPQLDQTCKRIARLKSIPIQVSGEVSRQIVATVATDGGESRLSLEPIHIQVNRILLAMGAYARYAVLAGATRPVWVLAKRGLRLSSGKSIKTQAVEVRRAL